MDYINISETYDLEKIIKKNIGVLVFFSSAKCNVGEAMEPKILNLIDEEFPKIIAVFVDINFFQKAATQYSVFVAPTILVFFEGKETLRKSRNIGLADLHMTIGRIYELAYE